MIGGSYFSFRGLGKWEWSQRCCSDVRIWHLRDYFMTFRAVSEVGLFLSLPCQNLSNLDPIGVNHRRFRSIVVIPLGLGYPLAGSPHCASQDGLIKVAHLCLPVSDESNPSLPLVATSVCGLPSTFPFLYWRCILINLTLLSSFSNLSRPASIRSWILCLRNIGWSSVLFHPYETHNEHWGHNFWVEDLTVA